MTDNISGTSDSEELLVLSAHYYIIYPLNYIVTRLAAKPIFSLTGRVVLGRECTKLYSQTKLENCRVLPHMMFYNILPCSF